MAAWYARCAYAGILPPGFVPSHRNEPAKEIKDESAKEIRGCTLITSSKTPWGGGPKDPSKKLSWKLMSPSQRRNPSTGAEKKSKRRKLFLNEL